MPETKDYKNLPENPGCYLFRDINGNVIYVGKAKNLKKRVSSYFLKKDHDPKTFMLVPLIKLIDYFITDSETEALILENNLIKKHYPKYNIDLKDSRRYAYLRLTNDEYPFLEVARTRELPGQYFGPFTSAKYRKEIQIILERNFGILTQKPSSLRKRSLDPAEYNFRIKKAIKILNGDVNELSKSLAREMQEASAAKNFEHALRLRNQIEALEVLKEKQNMELKRNYDSDVINFITNKNSVYLLIFNIYHGVLENKQEFEFPYTEDFLEEFILQYYEEHAVPKELIIPSEIGSPLVEVLRQKRGANIEVIVPEKGAKKALLDLVLKNVSNSLTGENARVMELQKVLSLKDPPKIIECFDISHLRGKQTVASMVVFRNGKPNKASYRKFRIQTDTNGDDFAAMREVIYRRYAKSLKETMPNPDLIVIDGGAGQLSSALSILKELRMNVPVISLAKRLEEIYLPNGGTPLRLEQKNAGLLLLRAIRDEAHRFAITYNRALRSRKIITGK